MVVWVWFAFLRLGFLGHTSRQLGAILCNLNKRKEVKRRTGSGRDSFWRIWESFPGRGCGAGGESKVRRSGTSASYVPLPAFGCSARGLAFMAHWEIAGYVCAFSCSRSNIWRG